jgi:hypothetical protein
MVRWPGPKKQAYFSANYPFFDWFYFVDGLLMISRKYGLLLPL